MLYFIFKIEPKAIQSFRFTKFGRKYQPDAVVKYKKALSILAKSQLPKDFKILKKGVAVSVRFVFPPLKSWSKKKINSLEQGEKIYKITRPDTDNLMKGFFDALNEIVYQDDSQIGKIEVEKIYGLNTHIEMCICGIEEFENNNNKGE